MGSSTTTILVVAVCFRSGEDVIVQRM